MLTLNNVLEDGFSFILPGNCVGELTVTDDGQYQVTALNIGHSTRELPPLPKDEYLTLVLGYTEIRESMIDRELRDTISYKDKTATSNFLHINHKEVARLLSLHRRFFHPITGREYGFRVTLMGIEFIKMITPLRISKTITPIKTTQELLYLLRELGENESSKGMKIVNDLIDAYSPEILKVFSQPLQDAHRDFSKK